MQVTIDNISEYGIGHNFSDPIIEQDLDYITYGTPSERAVVTEDPTLTNGTQAWWKEPSYDRWWKVGPRGKPE